MISKQKDICSICENRKCCKSREPFTEVCLLDWKERRITPEEETRFHNILDDVIRKLNSSKNSRKPHWRHESLKYLIKRANEEMIELDEALNEFYPFRKEIESENFDVIAFMLFFVDNLRGNK
jgi:NTP pyrophosphatase (non-canonical NTP hydrolase)